MTTPENKIKQKINKVLDSYGERLYRFMPVPSGFGKRTVDYLICFDGLFIAIEAKKPNGTVTPLQEASLTDIRTAGGSTFVIDDEEDLRALELFLGRIKQEVS